MIRLLTFFSLLVLVAGTQGFAQSGRLAFRTEVHNFGRVYKNDTPIKHDFIFENTGSAPVSVINVVSDCSCSTSSFTVDAVLPGETGTISITHDPYRAGPFEKVFTVTTNGSPKNYTLTIKGYIMPYSSTNTLSEFVHQNGNFKFKHKNLNFGTITDRTTVSKKFQFYNHTDKDITLTEKMMLPAHVKVYFDSSNVVKAGKVGTLVVTYDPKIKSNFGYLQDNIVLFDEKGERLEMTLAANIEPEQPVVMTASARGRNTAPAAAMATSPKLRLSESAQNLGNVYAHMGVVTEFVIYNEGTADLKILKILTDEGCELVSADMHALAPNESRVIKVKFNHIGKAGKQDRTLTILSNDPENAKQTVELKANVVLTGDNQGR